MTARELALRVINEVNINGAYANIAFAKEINNQRLSEQERRFATELIYGTIKSMPTLDWILQKFVNRRLDKIAPVILNVLRMGVYQIFLLTKVPTSAACNEAVKLARKYGHKGTVGFVNGVLRSVARSIETIKYPNAQDDPVQYLALKYFHPEWLITRWLERFGFEECEKLCVINNQTPALVFRTNTLKTNRNELMERLKQEGVTCEPSKWTPEGIVCTEIPSLASLDSLREGLFQVQDESSMMVAHVLDPKPGEFVIDACGAPGGKSTHIAALMKNKGVVLSVDIHEHKLALIKENAKRLGINIIQPQLLDATNLHEKYFKQADRVLVDAPCSGLGVLRRKPDSRWRKSVEMLDELPKLQTQILISASKCVKKGGVLVYSTCTTEPEENQYVIDSFLRSVNDFELDDVAKFLPALKGRSRMVQLLPHVDGVDGFFIARMIKK